MAAFATVNLQMATFLNVTENELAHETVSFSFDAVQLYARVPIPPPPPSLSFRPPVLSVVHLAVTISTQAKTVCRDCGCQ